ncbi:PAS domain S-box protein [bacterium]|nr:PAS domain S-box protein [bacterium]MDC0977678.1 PAS domain S-box protein [bacterium]
MYFYPKLVSQIKELEAELAKEKAEKNRLLEFTGTMEKSEQSFALGKFLETFAFPLYIIDAETFEIKAANEAARRAQIEEGQTCYKTTHHRNRPCDDEENPCPIKQAKKTKKTVVVEHVHYDRNGKRRYVEVYAHPIIENGIVTKIIEYTRDITELKQTEEMFTLINQVSDSVYLHDFEGNFKYINNAACAKLGLTREELMAKPLREIDSPKYAELIKPRVADLLETGQAVVFETVHIRKDGKKVPMEINVCLIEMGGEQLLLSVGRDITERKQAEEALRQSKEKFHELVNNLSEACWIAGKFGKLKWGNKATWKGLCKNSENEIIGVPHVKYVVKRDKRRVQEALLELWKEGKKWKAGKAEESDKPIKHLEYAIDPENNGREIIVQSSIGLSYDENGEPDEFQGFSIDVTKQKQFENALKYRIEFDRLITKISTNFINLSVEKIDDGINKALQLIGEFLDVDRCYVFLFDQAGKMLTNSHEWCAEGIDPQKDNIQNLPIEYLPWIAGNLLKSKTINVPDVDELQEIAPNEWAECRDQGIKAFHGEPLISGGRSSVIGALGVDSVQKKRIWSEDVITMLKLAAHVIASALDRKRAEEELLNLRKYLSDIINSMPSILVGVDIDGKVTQWNTEALRVTEIPPADALGKPLVDIFPRLSSELEGVQEAIKSRQPSSKIREPHKEDGKTYYENITIYPLSAGDMDNVVIRVDDVTEEVKLEERIVQSEKMMSLGGLATGIAHEIKNPLTIMMSAANVIRLRLSEEEIEANKRAAERAGTSMKAIRTFMEDRGIIKNLLRILEGGSRGDVIVNNILSYGRKSESKFLEQDLTELLKKAVDIARHGNDPKKKFDFRNIKINMEREEDLPEVPCDENLIQQVFINILLNGAQAIYKSETKNPCLTLSVKVSGEMIQVEIEDNGPGMDEETRKRVFEPFFTTNPERGGTGLGLSIAYKIITETHKGEMAVESKPDKGTKFIIGLPLGRKQQ